MRASGILMPVFSLCSKYGIGTLGKEAFNFVDFLAKAGQKYWQILPIGITGFGDSPYQSVSAFAGNPYFIDLDLLVKDGYLKEKDFKFLDFGKNPDRIDYESLYKNRYKVLRKAFTVFKSDIPSDFYTFQKENSYWLENYSLFVAIKDYHNGDPFSCWEEPFLKMDRECINNFKEEYKTELLFNQMIQYFSFKQWFALKDYANKKGVMIIGDMPIYVALDSGDVWSNPNEYQLDKNFKPKRIAGVPPDAFSKDGQLWGNPLYNWKAMKENNYSWWTLRLSHSAKLYDVVRIDHFRAFSAYFSIPYGDKTAKNGKWVKGPGKGFFQAMKNSLGELNIIAEDLGTIDDDVRKLLKFTGFPGMKVLQFAFDPNDESSYLPHNLCKNCITYTGTHDNDTLMGFMKDGDKKSVEFMKKYFNISDNEGFNWGVIKGAMASVADTVIFQMQDFLGLDNSARINTPATCCNNWQWRIGEGCINDWLAKIIREYTELYYRTEKKRK